MSSIVSSITGGITGNHGGAGLGFDAGQANVLNPSTVAQANQQYNNANNGLAQQQQFLQAVQAQNGLGNQSSVFNQLNGVAQGTGPNPAQAQLNQATGANVANQAALMAGQRGSNANAGLIARQASQQGANTQQQAAGQAATLQANQSLNALNSMGSLATNQANQQANALNSYNQSAQGLQSNVLSGIQGQNNANVGMTSNQNTTNSAISGIAAQQQGNLIGNVTGGIGSALGLAEGGMVPGKYANGGAVATPLNQAASSHKSFVGQFFNNDPAASKQAAAAQQYQGLANTGQMIGKGIGSLFSSTGASPQAPNGLPTPQSIPMASGGKVPVLLSPGEKVLSPEKATKVAEGKASPMAEGKAVPGKPKVAGAKNDYANDTYKTEEQEGSIVIPRSITQLAPKKAEAAAARFVRAHMTMASLKKGK